jgi:hypothetical protein
MSRHVLKAGIDQLPTTLALSHNAGQGDDRYDDKVSQTVVEVTMYKFEVHVTDTIRVALPFPQLVCNHAEVIWLGLHDCHDKVGETYHLIVDKAIARILVLYSAALQAVQ